MYLVLADTILFWHFPEAAHWQTLWQPWAEPGSCMLFSRSYLVCPPDHQVREHSDPGDGAKERDGKKLSWWLKESQEEVGASVPFMRWTWETKAKPTRDTTPHPIAAFHLCRLSTQKALPTLGQARSSKVKPLPGSGRFSFGNVG